MSKQLKPAVIYAGAKNFDIFNLVGLFDVKVTSGPFKLYKPSSWKKRFVFETYLKGWNVINDVTSGMFIVIPEKDYIELNYNIFDNQGSIWLNLKDHLKYDKDTGTYIGKIFMKTFWIYVPCGYFTLTHIGD